MSRVPQIDRSSSSSATSAAAPSLGAAAAAAEGPPAHLAKLMPSAGSGSSGGTSSHGRATSQLPSL
jgi:hypothetical protein